MIWKRFGIVLMAVFCVFLWTFYSNNYAEADPEAKDGCYWYWWCDKCGGGTKDLYTKCSNCGAQMEAFKVQVLINFKQNLFFSKFGVKVFIDDKLLATLDHGKGLSRKYRLSAGKHEIRIEKIDDPEKYVVIQKDIQNDGRLAAKIETNRFGVQLNSWDWEDIDQPYEVKFEHPTGRLGKKTIYFDLDTNRYEMIESWRGGTYGKSGKRTYFGSFTGAFDSVISMINSDGKITTNYCLDAYGYLVHCDSTGNNFEEHSLVDDYCLDSTFY